MKILVLNGSPKRDKSDTMHMTRAFLNGMNEYADNDIRTIHVIDSHIEYCTGCFVCKHNGGSCVLNDDMRGILDNYISSDLVIYNFPLYSYGMPAALKNFVDRLMPLSGWTMKREDDGKYGHSAQKNFSQLHYLMMCGCGYPNSKHNFEGAVRSFELKFPENSTIITVPESPMFNIPQASQFVAPRLEALKKAGKEYAKDFTISDELIKEICSPMIPEAIYAQFANGERR